MDFIIKLKEYALSIGFMDIDEAEITKSEHHQFIKSFSSYSLIMRKIHKDHFMYILVPIEFVSCIFYLRVYHRFDIKAAGGEYRMKMREFMQDHHALEYCFIRIYESVINYKYYDNDSK